MSVRPKELPLKTAWQHVRLERDAGDEMIHAYSGTRWLDSQRYFVIKGDPAGFDARIKKVTQTNWGSWEMLIKEGPGKDLWHRSEALPSWWDVDTLPAAIAVDVGSKGAKTNGNLMIFSKDRGLIYIIDR